MKKLLFVALLWSTLFACKDNGTGENKSSGSGEAVTLRLNFKQGEKFHYDMTTVQNITQTMMGKDMSVKQEMGFGFNYEVKSAEKEMYQVMVTYDRIRMKQDNPMMQVNFDTDDPATMKDGKFTALADLKGKSFTLTLNHYGDVTGISGLESLSNSLGQSGMSDTSMMNMMEMSFKIYPEKAMKVGDTWKKDMTNDLGGMLKMKIANEYELLSVKDGMAEIGVKSVITSEPGAAKQEMEMTLNGTQNGSMKVDVTTGMMLNSNFKQDITGKASTQGMEIPMKIKSDISAIGKKL
ncbi:MAG: hypothetical protein JNJ58_07975 [Chitinophagaceae bacterium]|nr:hypothetical protein [Chitinophagaceae bacterium]